MRLERRRGIPLDLTPPETGRRVGVEAEFSVYDANGVQLDFRQLQQQVAGSLRQLDPGDPRARRLPSGVALTADGKEAELATPPLLLSRSAGATIEALLRQERAALTAAARPHGAAELRGFSTHLNISVPDERVVEVGRRFTQVCAPALALITEPSDSWGVFVRARRGRLEYGGDYVDGPNLMRAIDFMAACVAGLLSGDQLPPLPTARVEPSREKFGWFLPEAHLTAPEHLDRVLAWAHPHAVALRLDLDSPGPPMARPEQIGTHPRTVHVDGVGEVGLETEWLTWNYAVWRITTATAQAFAVVPAEQEAEFLTRLDAGDWRQQLRQILRPSMLRRTLLLHSDLKRAALWHLIRPGALVPAERRADGSTPLVSARLARRSLRTSWLTSPS